MTRALRSKIRPLYAHLSHWGLDQIGQEPVGPMRRGLLRCLGRKALTPGSFAMAAAQSHDLQAAYVSTRSPPCLVGATPDVFRIPTRREFAFNFRSSNTGQSQGSTDHRKDSSRSHNGRNKSTSDTLPSMLILVISKVRKGLFLIFFKYYAY